MLTRILEDRLYFSTTIPKDFRDVVQIRGIDIDVISVFFLLPEFFPVFPSHVDQ